MCCNHLTWKVTNPIHIRHILSYIRIINWETLTNGFNTLFLTEICVPKNGSTSSSGLLVKLDSKKGESILQQMYVLIELLVIEREES